MDDTTPARVDVTGEAAALGRRLTGIHDPMVLARPNPDVRFGCSGYAASNSEHRRA